MAQMNKRPKGVESTRRGDLEKDLIGDITDQQALVETGRDGTHSNKYHLSGRARNRQFNIMTGTRRRHPRYTLNQFSEITKQTSNAESAWEKALMHEQERTEIPQDFRLKEGMIVDQVGLVTTALDNYVKSKGKFSRTHLTGV